MPAPMSVRKRALLIPGVFLVFTASAASRSTVQLSAQGSGVHVGRTHPPSNATRLGPVEGESGSGCAGFGTIGTYEMAEADLRNRTAAMGGDYAEIQTIVAPHDTGTQCPDNRMILRGAAYRTVAPPAAAAVSSPLSPPSAPAPAVAVCDPPCSPGYTCDAGSCVALCNPPCGPGQICRADRLCVPGG